MSEEKNTPPQVRDLNVPKGPPSFNKMFAYSISLAYNRAFQPKWSMIFGTRIVLGQLPDDDILDTIRKRYHLVAVLSICEAFELSPVLHTILSARAAGSAHLVIEEEDFGAVSVANLLKAAEFMNKCFPRDEHGVVYVHCKAGRGRSTACIMAYLMVFNGVDMYAAWRRIFASRPHISVDFPKVFALHELLLQIRAQHCINNGSSPEEERARRIWLHSATDSFMSLSQACYRWSTQAYDVQQKTERRNSEQNGSAGVMWRELKARAGQGLDKHLRLLDQYRAELVAAEEDYQTCLAAMFGGPAASIEKTRQVPEDTPP